MMRSLSMISSECKNYFLGLLNDLFSLNIIQHESNLSTECAELMKGLFSKRENKWQRPESTNQNAMVMEENYADFER